MPNKDKTSATVSALADDDKTEESQEPKNLERDSVKDDSPDRPIDPIRERVEDHGYWTGRIVIEIATPRNGNVMWGGNETILRGAWRRANLIADERVEALESMPDIPGMRIEIDTIKRRLRIFDPLSLPEFAETLMRARFHFKELFKQDAQPVQEVVNNRPSDTQIKTWLYWARRFVEGTDEIRDPKTRLLVTKAKADLIDGRLPTYEQIEALPGKTQIDFYNSNQRGKRFKEDFDEEEGF